MAKGLRLLGLLLYPVLVYLALQHFSPRVVGLAFALVLLLRHRRQSGQLWQGLASVQKGVLLALLLASGAVSLFDSEALLRLLPVWISLGMLLLFASTLRLGPSMIERFARLQTPELPAAGVAYTRQVTRCWCLFFVCNAALALWTALWASRETWLLYNGLLSYLLMGALFAGEWLYRRWRFPEVQA